MSENGWVEVETGWIRAEEVVAVTIEEQSYEVDRPSKGYSETCYFEGVIVTLRGGARLMVRQTSDSAVARTEVRRIVDTVDEIVTPVIEWGGA